MTADRGLADVALWPNLTGAETLALLGGGIMDTHMFKRVFGDTPEGRQAVLDQEPIGRMDQPDEIAAAVLWLCSEDAAFTIGHAMIVDGGQIA